MRDLVGGALSNRICTGVVGYVLEDVIDWDHTVAYGAEGVTKHHGQLGLGHNGAVCSDCGSCYLNC